MPTAPSKPYSPTAAQPDAVSADRAAKLAAVEASPEAVARHDRDAWLDLFTSDGVVEDPIGTPPCRRGVYTRRDRSGADDLARFYDTFIAPTQIRFEVDHDVVAGCYVLRDATLHVVMAGGLRAQVPTHLCYALREEDGALRIARLSACWNAPKLTRQHLAKGVSGYAGLALAGVRMVRKWGIERARQYSAGSSGGVRRGGVEAMEAFARTLREGDTPGFCALFAEGAEIREPSGRTHDPGSFAAGPGPALALRFDKLIPSGWSSSCTCYATAGGRERRGVAFFDFEEGTRQIRAARLFWE